MNLRCRSALRILATISLVASTAPAAYSASPPLSIDFIQSNGQVIATNLKGINADDQTLIMGNPAKLLFLCSAGIDCRKVAVTLKSNLPVDATEAVGSVSLTVDPDSSDNDLTIFFQGVAKLHTKLVLANKDAGTPTPPAGTTNGVPATQPGFVDKTELPQRLQNPCGRGSKLPAPPADLPKDHPFVFVTPTGKVLSANELPQPGGNPPHQVAIDESQSLTVYLLVDDVLASFINVRRKSALRDITAISLIGGTTTTSNAQLGREPIKVEPCQYRAFDLSDFAPGTGQVEINFPVDGQLSTVGSFDIRVDRLFRGILSFGVVSSRVSDKSFQLAPAADGSGKVIVASEKGDRQALYAVMLTPFIWGPRNLADEKLSFHKRFNPIFGLSTSNLTDHAFAGISFDYKWMVLSGGVHFARVTELAPKSGLHTGSPFTGAATDIPTGKRWTSSAFVAASLDLRVATQLLKAVAGIGK